MGMRFSRSEYGNETQYGHTSLQVSRVVWQHLAVGEREGEIVATQTIHTPQYIWPAVIIEQNFMQNTHYS